MSVISSFFEHLKKQISTTSGKISAVLYLLFAVFFIIHFIYSTIELSTDMLQVNIKHMDIELFPQFAICPGFGEQSVFTKVPKCAKFNRVYRNATNVPGVAKTLSHKFRDRTFTTTCYIFNDDATLGVGNESVACEFQLQSNGPRKEFGDADIAFTQAGDPAWWNFCGSGSEITNECPDGNNMYPLPRHSHSEINLETIAFADDDDAGYSSIKGKNFRSASAGGRMLPNREYKIIGHTFRGGERFGPGGNDTGVMIRWQSTDVWEYKPQTAISFWTWTSYIGGVLFLLSVIHSIIMTGVRIALGEDPTKGGEYSQIH